MKTRITEDMKTALKAQDKARLGVIRLMLAAIKQKEIDERISLTDQQVINVLEGMMKQCKESMVEYRRASRQDLVDKESFELSVIQHYMPEPLDSNTLEALIKQAITEANATSAREMGKVMSSLKPKIQGRADMAKVSARVKSLLSGPIGQE